MNTKKEIDEDVDLVDELFDDNWLIEDYCMFIITIFPILHTVFVLLF